jgi:hypothetical protein
MLSEKQQDCINRASKILATLENRLGNNPTYNIAGTDFKQVLDSLFAQAEENLEEAFRKRFKLKKGTRLPEDWVLPLEWRKYASEHGYSSKEIDALAEDFRDYWVSRTGSDAMKASWKATWQMRVRQYKKYNPTEGVSEPQKAELDELGEDICKTFPSIGRAYWMMWMKDTCIEEGDSVVITFKSKLAMDRIREIAHKLESYFGKSVILKLGE